MGRIEVNVDSKKGRSSGSVIIPSSLDQVETAILAAALETIERVALDIERLLKEVPSVQANAVVADRIVRIEGLERVRKKLYHVYDPRLTGIGAKRPPR